PLGRRLSKDYCAAPRVSLVMCVFNGLGDTRACLESLRATTEPFRLVVMDNGSTDGTPEFFERFPYPYPLVFARRPANDGVIAAAERGRRCLVVHAPFRHHGGRTRTRDFERDPTTERADLAMRDAALVRFAQKWRPRLPKDVRSARQRVGDWLRVRSAPLAWRTPIQ